MMEKILLVKTTGDIFIVNTHTKEKKSKHLTFSSNDIINWLHTCFIIDKRYNFQVVNKYIEINAETSDLNPRVMCTSKSESDRWIILECVDIKIIPANLVYTHLISIGYCSTNRIWRQIQLRFELFTLIYPKKLVFPITWFLLVTVQPMGLRDEWSTDSSSPSQKTSNYHLCDRKIEL